MSLVLWPEDAQEGTKKELVTVSLKSKLEGKEPEVCLCSPGWAAFPHLEGSEIGTAVFPCSHHIEDILQYQFTWLL